MKILGEVNTYIEDRLKNRLFSILGVLLFLLSTVFTILHYNGKLYGNNLSWILWLTSMFLLFFAFLPGKFKPGKYFQPDSKTKHVMMTVFAVVYFVSHLINYNNAPWNNYGLFDDAAWDIFFKNNHVLSGKPYQAAFFDNVGSISRETTFHYYIGIMFRLFGENLFVFNMALIILGYITVIFTAKLANKMFKNVLITIVTFLLLNFYPLHYMHVFSGHRYVMAMPLMMVSLYFIYTAYKQKSIPRAMAGALFAALCLDSAIMGKQYIYALAASALLLLLTERKTALGTVSISTTVIASGFFMIAAMPLMIYIVFNPDLYNIREGNLLAEFFEKLQADALYTTKEYLDRAKEVFFAAHSYDRWFLPDSIPIPYFWYPLIIAGLVFSFIKKRYEILFISLIPVAASLISGCIDIRLLLAAPAWILSISVLLSGVFSIKHATIKKIALITSTLLLAAGFIPSLIYITKVSSSPNHFWLLKHTDVAVMRYVQDIVAGEAEPDISIKGNEFTRSFDRQVEYNVLFTPDGPYSIAHLYLQNLGYKDVLSFNNYLPAKLFSGNEKEVFKNNLTAVKNIKENSKALKLIWEFTPNTAYSVSRFKKLNLYDRIKKVTVHVDGQKTGLIIMDIDKDNVNNFRKEVIKIKYEE